MNDNNNSKPMSENLILDDEKAILLDHNYDGIEELDNPLPKWWQIIFYGAIIYSFVYVGYYEFGSGPSLQDELNRDMAKWAEIQDAAKQQDGGGNDSLLAIWNNESERTQLIEAGRSVYAMYCAACHGDLGQGVIGPNLTDSFWIHGKGQLADIAHVVATGVADKGMPPWEAVLKPEEFKGVTFFVASLKGTNPANAKAAEGNEVQ